MSKRFETTQAEIDEIHAKAALFSENMKKLEGKEVTLEKYNLKGSILLVGFKDDYSGLSFKISWSTGAITYEDEDAVKL